MPKRRAAASQKVGAHTSRTVHRRRLVLVYRIHTKREFRPKSHISTFTRIRSGRSRNVIFGSPIKNCRRSFADFRPRKLFPFGRGTLRKFRLARRPSWDFVVLRWTSLSSKWHENVPSRGQFWRVCVPLAEYVPFRTLTVSPVGFSGFSTLISAMPFAKKSLSV